MTALAVVRRSEGRTRVAGLIIAFIIAFGSLFMSVGVAHAADDAVAAKQQLQQYVYKQMAATSYELEGGGSILGKDLFSQDGKNFNVNDAQFSTLSKKGQGSFTGDLVTQSNNAASANNPTKASDTPLVTDQTTSSWFKDLQSTPGMGSKLLAEVLSNTKPDFVTANKIYEPFSGIMSTVIALITIVFMAFLVLSMAADLAYITLPFVRGKDEGKDSKMFSHPARSSVKEAEGEQGGGQKEALWLYLKKRILQLVVLGFCILLLVSGEVFGFVGMIVDWGVGLVT